MKLPYRDNVSSLIHESSFRSIIEPRLFPMLKYTIHLGNVAVHTNSSIKRDEAVIALRDLYEFCDWIDYSYSTDYVEKTYDESLLASGDEKRVKAEELKQLYENLSSKDKKLENVLKENEELRKQMADQRSYHTQTREFHVDQLSEAKTRKKYIDVALNRSECHRRRTGDRYAKCYRERLCGLCPLGKGQSSPGSRRGEKSVGRYHGGQPAG